MNLSTDKLVAAFSHFMRRYHVVLYCLTVIVGVAVAIFMLSNLFTGEKTEDTPTAISGFDQATIKRLDKLNVSSSVNPHLELPAGRVNPFAE